MLHFAWLALVAGSSLTGNAEAPNRPATPQGFGFCTVTDNSGARGKIWASPVFPVTYGANDPTGFQRSQELAGEFLTHVGTLGGSGTKSCVVLPTQSETAAFREEQRALWDKRVYFIKVGDWREVAWAPAAGSPAKANATTAELTRYFYCYNVDINVPSSRSHTVATAVFARKVRGGNPTAAYDLAAAYTNQFKQQVSAHGLPAQGDCMPFDTRAEAEYQQQQIRKHFKGFKMTFDEITWTPSEGGSAAAAPATGQKDPAPARAAEQTAAAKPPVDAVKTVPSADALNQAQYCTAYVARSKEGLNLRLPIREFPLKQADQTAMREKLSGVIAAAIQAHAVKWMAFPPVTCIDNSGVNAGETFCFSVITKHFGGTQIAAQFCNASKAMIDKRFADMVKADAGTAREFQWP